MNLKQAILSTLAYHDIFNYPLTASELHKFSPVKSEPGKTEREVANLVRISKIGKIKNYYFLKKRSNTVKIRKNRYITSNRKIKRAQIYANLLKLVPSIKLVGISGALAMENSTASDDIDFVIIAKANLLWTTRFFANVLLYPFKRDPKSKKQKDKACLNLFLDELDLRIKEHNQYTAHEICQLKLLWDKNGTYQKFIKSNIWISKFLPNWRSEIKPVANTDKKAKKGTDNNTLLFQVERFLKNFQLNYMSSKITTEKIGDRQLFFHPGDTQNEILLQYNKKLKRLTK